MRRYYSSRHNRRSLEIGDVYTKVVNLFEYFQHKQYFKQQLEIDGQTIPESATRIASLALEFCPFPIEDWPKSSQTEDSLFDLLEFLFDHISRPGELGPMVTETNYHYYDFLDYDPEAGREELRKLANAFLCDYRTGYEISPEGVVLSLDPDLQGILDAQIIPFDKEHVDDKVNVAINKWRNRHLDISERKQAIREMADVFEWLKKSGDLANALASKDDSDLFNIANNFHIRHHSPNQSRTYDEGIWCSWMFHFYLATYHAAIRLLKKNENRN